MKYILIFFLLLIVTCETVLAKPRPEEAIITTRTQLEKRQFQTRTYDANDKVIVMKSLLNVLQDEEFLVYNVNSLLGFVYAVKDFDLSDSNVDISKEFGFTKSRLNYNGIKIATLEATANITEYGKSLRVRINFKRKLLNEYGNAQFINNLEEKDYYNEFYEKLDSAISLNKKLNQIEDKQEVQKQEEQPCVEKIEVQEEEPTKEIIEDATFVNEQDNNENVGK